MCLPVLQWSTPIAMVGHLACMQSCLIFHSSCWCHHCHNKSGMSLHCFTNSAYTFNGIMPQPYSHLSGDLGCFNCSIHSLVTIINSCWSSWKSYNGVYLFILYVNFKFNKHCFIACAWALHLLHAVISLLTLTKVNLSLMSRRQPWM